jgi:hypothetical protein
VKRKARRTKCRYCGSVDERARMRALAEETPKDFVAPKLWTPPADREVEPGKPLAYNAPLHPAVVIAGSAAAVALLIGVPMLWQSRMWNTRPDVLEHASPVGKRADVAKKLEGSVESPTQIVVQLNSERYDKLVIRYGAENDVVPLRVSFELRRGQKPDEAARDLLSSRLNGGLDRGNWSWGDVQISWSTIGLSAEIGRSSPEPLRERRALAAWSLLLGAAFNPAITPSPEEMRGAMGGGYPVSMLSKIAPSTPLEQAKSTSSSTFPGALVEASIQMHTTVPLDHPFLRWAKIDWFVMPGGTVDDVSFQTKPALRGGLDAFARCLTPALGPPRVTIVDPIAGTKSYSFHPGTAQIDLNTALVVRAFGAHGVPTTVDDETWRKLVGALDGCRG